MKPFQLRKVIDPIANMPYHIQKIWRDLTVSWDMSNDSFKFWTVAQYDYSHPSDSSMKAIDDWLISNGLVKDEEVIILNWW